MAILDKLRGVGEAVRDKVKETFGEPTGEGSEEGTADVRGQEAPEGPPPLDVHGAFALLGLAEGATLADVRESYRALARRHHPIARRDGIDSEAARTLDRLLEALELLEEQLVPLAGGGGAGSGAGPAGGGASAGPAMGTTGGAGSAPRRKRATPRGR